MKQADKKREQAQKAVNEALKAGNKEQAAVIAAEYKEQERAEEQEREAKAVAEQKALTEAAEAAAAERLKEERAEAAAKVLVKGIAKEEAEARRSGAAKAVAEGKSLNAICRNIIAAAKDRYTKKEQAALLQFVGIEYPNAKADNITAEHIEQVKAATIIKAAKVWSKYISKEAEEMRAGQIAELKSTEAKGLYLAALVEVYTVSKVYLQPANNKAAKRQPQSLEIGAYYIIDKGKATKVTAVRAEKMIKEAREAAANLAKEREAAAEQAERDRAAGEAARLQK